MSRRQVDEREPEDQLHGQAARAAEAAEPGAVVVPNELQAADRRCWTERTVAEVMLAHEDFFTMQCYRRACMQIRGTSGGEVGWEQRVGCHYNICSGCRRYIRTSFARYRSANVLVSYMPNYISANALRYAVHAFPSCLRYRLALGVCPPCP